MLVLFLTVQPVCGSMTNSSQAISCCDNDDCAGDEQGQSGDSDHERTCKVCNPFQSCGCCTGSVALMQAPFLFSWRPAEQITVVHSCLVLHLKDAPAADFWQPPRA